MTKYAIPLDDPHATLEIAGGKGASLAMLANSGLPVPDGFHVTTAAYREFVTTAGLQTKILTALDVVDVSHSETLEAAARTIRDIFAQGEMSSEIAGALVQAYTSLP
ncbi:MAG: pyruvate, phosphate dikinase, partial [Anaerolineae bacterium]|nr:pyruvate, phosphate dikinase [Anaerolineae bacterium]